MKVANHDWAPFNLTTQYAQQDHGTFYVSKNTTNKKCVYVKNYHQQEMCICNICILSGYKGHFAVGYQRKQTILQTELKLKNKRVRKWWKHGLGSQIIPNKFFLVCWQSRHQGVKHSDHFHLCKYFRNHKMWLQHQQKENN